MGRWEESLLYRRETCRLCEGRELAEVLSLRPSPPANAMVRKEDLGKTQPLFPLDVFLCLGCGHVQLLDVVNPSLLFQHYVYMTGVTAPTVDHFRAYAAEMIQAHGLRPGHLIVEVGSNDGTLLRFFQEAGMRVLGVDPARNLAEMATASGVETLADFFTAGLARQIRAERGPAALVAANNVFAHADGLRDIAEGARDLLSPEGVFVFEVSYLVDVYEKLLFDTIYHEHLSYHSVHPLVQFFKRNGMRLIDAARVPAQGGSIRGKARKAEGRDPVSPDVQRLVDLELRLGLDKPYAFREYGARLDERKRDLRALLTRLKAKGKRIAGFGAPAKATTLMHHFELGGDTIDFLVDDTPLKQGLYTPGYHLPVYPSSVLYERKPDYLLIYAWNYADSIIAKHEDYAAAGGRFIVPLPELRVV